MLFFPNYPRSKRPAREYFFTISAFVAAAAVAHSRGNRAGN